MSVAFPIEELIPHRRPFLLVDRLVSVEGHRVVAERRITVDDPLLCNGMAGPLAIEALAQTAACLMGVRNRGRSGHHGYLVAARGWKFPDHARVGDTVTLVAEQTSSLGALHGFRGEARVDDREIASGEMTFAVEFGGA